MTIFSENLALLSVHNSNFAKYISTVHPDDINLIQCKDGHYTIEYENCLLHSEYYPVLEAQKQINMIQPATKVFVYGFGLGYQAIELLNDVSFQKLHIVIIRASLTAAILKAVRLDFLDNPRLSFRTEKNFCAEDSYCVLPAECLRADNQHYALRDDIFFNMRESWLENRWVVRQQDFQSHVDQNHELIKSIPGVDQFIQQNKPKHRLLIIGAGPSLDDIKLTLSQLSKSCFVIVLDAAVSVVVAAGIRVDAILTIDPSPRILDFFTAESISQVNQDCSLIFFPIVHPEIIRRWPWQKYTAFSRSQNNLIQPIEAGNYLETQGSVLHPALSLCEKLEAKQIILAGIDLSFPGKATHAANVPGKEIPENMAVNLLPVQSVNGSKTFSSPDFLSYLRETEDYIQGHQHIDFVNLSPIGALIVGCRNIHIDAFILECDNE